MGKTELFLCKKCGQMFNRMTKYGKAWFCDSCLEKRMIEEKDKALSYDTKNWKKGEFT